MTGIADVAQAVGLSTATVSRALRGLPGVSPHNRAIIEAAAAELHYAPSRAAAGLASGQTHDIAVVVPYLTRWYFTQVTHGAEEVLTEAGYDVMLYHLRGQKEPRRRALQTPYFAKRVDGIVVIGLQPTAAETAWLGRHAPPVSLVGSEVPGWPSVRIDDHGAATTAMEHLTDLGHRRIGYVGLSLDAYVFSTPQERLRGYREHLTAHGLRSDPAWEVAGEFRRDTAEEGALRMLAREDRPTAVFAASDEMAFGVLSAAQQLGLRVPEDLSVIGIDDHEMAGYLDLTTVAQPVLDLGRSAAHLLLRRLAGDTDPSTDGLLLPTRLCVRGTTGPAPDAGS